MLDSEQDQPKTYFEKKKQKEKLAFRRLLKKKLKSVLVWTVVVLTVLFTAGGIFLSVRRGGGEQLQAHQLIAPFVKIFEDEGRTHIADGEKFENYNSNPPTSGPHYAVPAKWGIYEAELPDGQLIHNLEHCGIWISYRPNISAELKEKIVNFARGFPIKVIVTPRAKNDHPVSLAAWRTLMHLDTFDDIKMNAFVLSFLNQAGPECQAS